MLSISLNQLLKLLKFTLLASLSFVFTFAFSQSTVWNFGQNTGISFNSAGVPTVLMNSSMNTPEGCASISSANGQIANYSNGEKLWDGQGNLVANDLNGDKNAIQSAIFLPKPNDNDTVYLFTLDADVGQGGLSYSVIVNKNIVNNKKNISLLHNVTERMCVVQNCNNQDAWLIVHTWNNSLFYVFKITGEGIDTVPVISNVGSVHSGNLLNATGYMKASQLGDRLAVAKMGSGTVELFHFDNINGTLSNSLLLNGLPAVYGLEFNELASILYVSTASGNLSNFSLANWNVNDIQNSRQIIQSSGSLLGALQMGPNNKIYVARDNSYFIGRIASPDNMGTACSYIADFLYLNGNKCEAGLPPFVAYPHSFLPFVNVSCLGDTSYFNVMGDNFRIDSIRWDFGDSTTTADFSTNLAASYLFPAKGKYQCNLFVFHCDVVDTLKLTAQVLDVPTVDLGADTSFCENSSFVINTKVNGAATYLWNDGSMSPNMLVNKSGVYWVRINSICGVTSDTLVISNVWLNPKPNLPIDTFLCKGDSLILDGGADANSYLWQNQFTDRFFVVKDSGNIALAVIDSNLCEGNTQVFIDIDDVPVSRLANDTTICFGKSILLNAGSADYYQWQNYSGGQYYRVIKEGTYWVELFNQCGSTSDTIDIMVDDCLQNIAIPNAFTPNNDGLNDFFLPQAENITNYEMHIYNKWGHEIFVSYDLNRGWDGTESGRQAINDVYVYIIRYSNHRGESYNKRGFVNLIR